MYRKNKVFEILIIDLNKESEGLVGRDLASEVSCVKPYGWSESGPGDPDVFYGSPLKTFKVVALDFGLKYNQLRLHWNKSLLPCMITC